MFENAAVEGPAGFLAAATELLAKLPSELWRTGNDGFAGIAAAVDALAVQLDCTRVGLVQEAQSRGVVSESSCASSTDWLLANSDHLEPADAARTVDLARLCGLPKNQVMAAAVSGGTLTVRKAMTALRSLSSLKLCPLANGMIAIRGQLDPESGAVLTAALDPLSAPTPCEANGGRDPRQADRRRADALIELCRRATAAGSNAPTTSKAQIVVTIDYDRLLGAVRGSGTTLAGQVLSPQTVRKLACDASIIPMVLGPEGQPLDVGRTKRLVTPALLAALWARDKGCSYPGCGRPPQWSDAHLCLQSWDGSCGHEL